MIDQYSINSRNSSLFEKDFILARIFSNILKNIIT